MQTFKKVRIAVISENHFTKRCLHARGCFFPFHLLLSVCFGEYSLEQASAGHGRRDPLNVELRGARQLEEAAFQREQLAAGEKMGGASRSFALATP